MVVYHACGELQAHLHRRELAITTETSTCDFDSTGIQLETHTPQQDSESTVSVANGHVNEAAGHFQMRSSRQRPQIRAEKSQWNRVAAPTGFEPVVKP